MADEVTRSSSFERTVDHGDKLRFSALNIDAKLKNMLIIFECHNGSDWTGANYGHGFLEIKVTVDGTIATKIDKTTVSFPNINFDDVAVRSLVDYTKILAFVTSNNLHE